MSYHTARFSPQLIAEGVKFLQTFAPSDEIGKRDKVVLEKFFVDRLTYTGIAALNDPRILSLGNRSKGKQLTCTQISRIVYKYFPAVKNVPAKKPKNEERYRLMKARIKEPSPHVKRCAFCGSKDRLEEHHMIPLAMGGTNDNRNLVFLCSECHKQVTKYQTNLLRSAFEGDPRAVRRSINGAGDVASNR